MKKENRFNIDEISSHILVAYFYLMKHFGYSFMEARYFYRRRIYDKSRMSFERKIVEVILKGFKRDYTQYFNKRFWVSG